MNSLHKFFNYTVPVLMAFQITAFFGSAPLAAAAAPAVIALPSIQESRYNAQYLSANTFLELTNTQRAERGVAPLTLNNQLTSAAENKAIDMDVKEYWDHFRPSDHKAPWDFITEAGYTYHVAGENLARGFRTPEGITKAWMASPTHAANILSPKYTEVGFATIEAPDQNGKTILLTVQMFGSK